MIRLSHLSIWIYSPNSIFWVFFLHLSVFFVLPSSLLPSFFFFIWSLELLIGQSKSQYEVYFMLWIPRRPHYSSPPRFFLSVFLRVSLRPWLLCSSLSGFATLCSEKISVETTACGVNYSMWSLCCPVSITFSLTKIIKIVIQYFWIIYCEDFIFITIYYRHTNVRSSNLSFCVSGLQCLCDTSKLGSYLSFLQTILNII